jgi:hypothetical protein
MKIGFRIGFAGAAAVIAAAFLSTGPAAAQVLPRIKGRVISFDGTTLTVAPLPARQTRSAGPAPPPAKPGMSHGVPRAMPATAGAEDAAAEDAQHFTVLPDTRYVGTAAAAFADIKPGDFVGAAVREGSGGRLRAEEIYLYPAALRGAGEGRFTENGRLIVNGTVSDVKPGMLTLHYRGLVLNGKVCEGRAPPPAFASGLSCSGDAVLAAGDDAKVTALTDGNASLVTPDAVVTVSVAKNGAGELVAPGIIVEKPQSPP